MANIEDPSFDEPREREGFRALRARLGRQAGAERLGLVCYPDSGKLGGFERLPDGSGLSVLFRLADEVDYYDGERPPQDAV